jgi:hypothetical protein
VILDKSLTTVPVFSPAKWDDFNNSSLLELLEGLGELIYAKHLEPVMEQV